MNVCWWIVSFAMSPSIPRATAAQTMFPVRRGSSNWPVCSRMNSKVWALCRSMCDEHAIATAGPARYRAECPAHRLRRPSGYRGRGPFARRPSPDSPLRRLRCLPQYGKEYMAARGGTPRTSALHRSGHHLHRRQPACWGRTTRPPSPISCPLSKSSPRQRPRTGKSASPSCRMKRWD